MSADAIDVMAKGVSKDKPTIKYNELTGIPLSQTAAIGDSGGDMAMLRLVAQNGGKVAYVAKNKDHTNELASYGESYVKTSKLGPEGAIQFIDALLSLK